MSGGRGRGPREQDSSIHHVLVPALGPGWDAGWGGSGEGNTQSFPPGACSPTSGGDIAQIITK